MTSIYLQHELTSQEIARDRAKAAAISRNRAKAAAKHVAPRDDMEIVYTDSPATIPQQQHFERLLNQLALVDSETHAKAASWWPTVKDTIQRQDISNAINRLKIRIAEAGNKKTTHNAVCTHGAPFGPQCNKTPAAATAPLAQPRTPRDRFEDVPDGYYAVNTEEGELAFYRVSTWRDGNRKVQVQASDVLHLIRGWKATDAILAKVRTVTPPLAGLEYANKIGRCWRCGRTLTKSASRSRGMGADCASKY